MIQINIVSLTFLTRRILPQMVERKSGYIISIGSIVGSYPYPGDNVYGATKAFVRQFNLNLCADLAGTDTRATDIESGLCDGTRFSGVCFKGNDGRATGVYENIRSVRPEDIVDTTLQLYCHPVYTNVNTIEVMPAAQSLDALLAVREVPPAPEPEESLERQSTPLFAKIKSWFR